MSAPNSAWNNVHGRGQAKVPPAFSGWKGNEEANLRTHRMFHHPQTPLQETQGGKDDRNPQ